MAASTPTDRRLREREVRQGNIAPRHYDAEDQALEDLAEKAEFPSEEGVEHLAEELEAEKVARELRIERTLAEPAKSELPLVPLTPLDIE
jgi:hypothetical protein